ncbi:Glu-tRNA(Gln) amidotransferase GatDE subunit E [Candidatus Woesearchaeota archaeon]|nr:MAG: Glu-tRNA(Gln) amidotransferase GatDE subunit E [Candidatus Woesearchaeota archaeon]
MGGSTTRNKTRGGDKTQSGRAQGGLRCGLEIHQQLNTGKLFCRCPTTISDGKPDFVFSRTLRALAGETGQVDRAAQHEASKAKRFTYHSYAENCCLVEMDEEPPHPMNEQALLAALQTARLLDAHILDEISVMRKTVIDGSNTSGFQRTALIALGGELREEAVRIQTICLEEDAAKIVSRREHEDVYNLSRLGIPLIEIATEPDITSPEQAQRAAAELGMLLRSTGACKRGLGTIRQDVNISVTGGARVEIKGAQDLKLIPTIIENEMARQTALIAIAEELGARAPILPPPPKNVSAQFAQTRCAFIKRGLARGAALIGLALPGFAGLLGRELAPGHRLGTELAGYAKSFGFGGLIHSDEDLKKYAFTAEEVAATKKVLGVKRHDAFLLFLGEPERINDLLAFLLLPRIERLRHGVPQEVRKAEANGTSTFLRPMPGAARMYPETDIPTITPPKSFAVPKPLAEQRAALVKRHKITEQQASRLLRQGWDLDAFVKRYPSLGAAFLTTTLLDAPKELRKRYKRELDLTTHEDALHTILEHAEKGTIAKDAVIDLLADVADGRAPDISRYATVDEATITAAVQRALRADPTAPVPALMGVIMKELRGRASGKEVMRILKELKNAGTTQ